MDFEVFRLLSFYLCSFAKLIYYHPLSNPARKILKKNLEKVAREMRPLSDQSWSWLTHSPFPFNASL
jgi:hypothetical protein